MDAKEPWQAPTESLLLAPARRARDRGKIETLSPLLSLWVRGQEIMDTLRRIDFGA